MTTEQRVGVASGLRGVESVLLGVVAGLVAGIGVALVSIQLSGGGSGWAGESVIFALAAAAWMAAGLAVQQRYAVARLVIFAAGAMVAWFFSLGIVHSVSAYYGLVQFAAACVGAAMVWTVRVRGGNARFAAIMIPFLTMVGATAATLAATPGLGVRRSLTDAGGRRDVFIIRAPSNTGYYLWSSASRPLLPMADSTIRLEPDPGSGAGPYHATQLRDAEAIRRICDAFRSNDRSRLEGEIAGGSVPPLITRLPVRSADCEGGSVWFAPDRR